MTNHPGDGMSKIRHHYRGDCRECSKPMHISRWCPSEQADDDAFARCAECQTINRLGKDGVTNR